MRYIFLLFFTTFLFIACGNETGTATANNKNLTPKVKQKLKKSPKKGKPKSSGYWGYMKKNAGLTDTQTKQLMVLTGKKSKTIASLKKQRKWGGKQYEATRKNLASTHEKEMKAILGTSSNWSKWKGANVMWKTLQRTKAKQKRTKAKQKSLKNKK